jgi:hypothetical protein
MNKTAFPKSAEYRGNKDVIYFQRQRDYQRCEVRFYDVDGANQSPWAAVLVAAIAPVAPGLRATVAVAVNSRSSRRWLRRGCPHWPHRSPAFAAN